VSAKGRRISGPSTRSERRSPLRDASPALSALAQGWDELGFNPFASNGDYSWPESNGLVLEESEPEQVELPAEERRLKEHHLEEPHPLSPAFPLRGTSYAGFTEEVPLRGRGLNRAYPSTPAVQEYRRKKGRQGWISATELGRWSYRLAAEEKLLALAEVPVVPLPAFRSPVVYRVWRGFRLLVACAWTHTYGLPVGFERRFAAAWCEVTEDEARAAIKFLREAGLIVQVGTSGHLRLWLPKGAA
jgi:hypothetical protein